MEVKLVQIDFLFCVENDAPLFPIIDQFMPVEHSALSRTGVDRGWNHDPGVVLELARSRQPRIPLQHMLLIQRLCQANFLHTTLFSCNGSNFKCERHAPQTIVERQELLLVTTIHHRYFARRLGPRC